MINIGIIGFGYWGPNLLRNFLSLRDCLVVGIADINKKKLRSKIKNNIKIYDNASELIEDKSVDAVVIATPVKTHYSLAIEVLKQGKHVLIEKPMAMNRREALNLMEISEKKRITLMVDHTYVYNPAITKIKEYLDNNYIGELKYFDSIRINLGLIQSDINVLWDLAVHDLSILLHLIKRRPTSLNCTGISHLQNNLINIGYITLNFEDDFICHLNCSWSSPVKIRHIILGGDKRMILFNDLDPTEKVKVYNSKIKVKDKKANHMYQYDYRIGDVFSPNIKNEEALHFMSLDFIKCIKSSAKPLSNAQMGLEIVTLLKLADDSLNNNGQEILIKNNV